MNSTMKWLMPAAVFSIIGFVLTVFVFGIIFLTTYNGLVSHRNNVDQKWANVEAAYQRRLDTLPKFAQTAKFSAEFQLKLATEYARQREGLTKAAATGDPNALQNAANEGFQVLLVAVRQEAVPEAKTDQLTELNSQVENVERVINHERDAFNESLRDWFNKRQGFPGNFVGGLFGVSGPQHNRYFEAQPGAEQSPNIDLKLP